MGFAWDSDVGPKRVVAQVREFNAQGVAVLEFTDLAGRMFASADIEAIFESSRLGAVPPGALFLSTPGQTPVLRIVDAPARPVKRTSCATPDGYHRYGQADGECRQCGETRPAVAATGVA